jgi:glycosyltransferase involved in cell wall biosynthesis
MRLKVLCLIDYYLPGYKAGGPVRTISNMVELLKNEINFSIITRDHDLNDDHSYNDIKVNCWNQINQTKIFYTDNWANIINEIRSTKYDILYLNSFFSPVMTGIPLLLHLFRLAHKKPVILAVRGELSKGALSIKPNKKRLYILLSKFVGLYKNIIWQASNQNEAKDILHIFGESANNIHIAPDLLNLTILKNIQSKKLKSTNKLSIIFLSRISPKKNLNFLLKTLRLINSHITLTICGPISDNNYWRKCKNTISSLPRNIKVVYIGDAIPEDIPLIFSKHDLFAFPTLNENFGHVIIESLSSGTPVILSNQTPWTSDRHGAVEVIPLTQQEAWVNAIKRWAGFNDAKRIELRSAAKKYAAIHIDTFNTSSIKSNLDIFKIAVKKARP